MLWKQLPSWKRERGFVNTISEHSLSIFRISMFYLHHFLFTETDLQSPSLFYTGYPDGCVLYWQWKKAVLSWKKALPETLSKFQTKNLTFFFNFTDIMLLTCSHKNIDWLTKKERKNYERHIAIKFLNILQKELQLIIM